MPGPLEGVRVIDLSSMISGPLTGMILADQGADVIKVEAPMGDSARHVATRRGGFSASFLNNNRNKRSVVLDLKKDGARDALLKLFASADEGGRTDIRTALAAQRRQCRRCVGG